ncbi:hypothetical protein [Lachnobacterium bovis]|uniref:hypothetical protein n=1 Tax=Lachnobacterium bovis TaxID=140626 RepID=UPI00055556CD|nr:hypothetical protein [Lachnobacterium bovis]
MILSYDDDYTSKMGKSAVAFIPEVEKAEVLNGEKTRLNIGENKWVEGWKWYDAIRVRKNGIATQEHIELLDKGHWKE